jgi:hypothetical protein
LLDLSSTVSPQRHLRVAALPFVALRDGLLRLLALIPRRLSAVARADAVKAAHRSLSPLAERAATALSVAICAGAAAAVWSAFNTELLPLGPLLVCYGLACAFITLVLSAVHALSIASHALACAAVRLVSLASAAAWLALRGAAGLTLLPPLARWLAARIVGPGKGAAAAAPIAAGAPTSAPAPTRRRRCLHGCARAASLCSVLFLTGALLSASQHALLLQGVVQWNDHMRSAHRGNVIAALLLQPDLRRALPSAPATAGSGIGAHEEAAAAASSLLQPMSNVELSHPSTRRGVSVRCPSEHAAGGAEDEGSGSGCGVDRGLPRAEAWSGSRASELRRQQRLYQVAPAAGPGESAAAGLGESAAAGLGADAAGSQVARAPLSLPGPLLPPQEGASPLEAVMARAEAEAAAEEAAEAEADVTPSAVAAGAVATDLPTDAALAVVPSAARTDRHAAGEAETASLAPAAPGSDGSRVRPASAVGGAGARVEAARQLIAPHGRESAKGGRAGAPPDSGPTAFSWGRALNLGQALQALGPALAKAAPSLLTLLTAGAAQVQRLGRVLLFGLLLLCYRAVLLLRGEPAPPLQPDLPSPVADDAAAVASGVARTGGAAWLRTLRQLLLQLSADDAAGGEPAAAPGSPCGGGVDGAPAAAPAPLLAAWVVPARLAALLAMSCLMLAVLAGVAAVLLPSWRAVALAAADGAAPVASLRAAEAEAAAARRHREREARRAQRRRRRQQHLKLAARTACGERGGDPVLACLLQAERGEASGAKHLHGGAAGRVDWSAAYASLPAWLACSRPFRWLCLALPLPVFRALLLALSAAALVLGQEDVGAATVAASADAASRGCGGAGGSGGSDSPGSSGASESEGEEGGEGVAARRARAAAASSRALPQRARACTEALPDLQPLLAAVAQESALAAATAAARHEAGFVPALPALPEGAGWAPEGPSESEEADAISQGLESHEQPAGASALPAPIFSAEHFLQQAAAAREPTAATSPAVLPSRVGPSGPPSSAAAPAAAAPASGLHRIASSLLLTMRSALGGGRGGDGASSHPIPSAVGAAAAAAASSPSAAAAAAAPSASLATWRRARSASEGCEACLTPSHPLTPLPLPLAAVPVARSASTGSFGAAATPRGCAGAGAPVTLPLTHAQPLSLSRGGHAIPPPVPSVSCSGVALPSPPADPAAAPVAEPPAEPVAASHDPAELAEPAAVPASPWPGAGAVAAAFQSLKLRMPGAGASASLGSSGGFSPFGSGTATPTLTTPMGSPRGAHNYGRPPLPPPQQHPQPRSSPLAAAASAPAGATAGVSLGPGLPPHAREVSGVILPRPGMVRSSSRAATLTALVQPQQPQLGDFPSAYGAPPPPGEPLQREHSAGSVASGASGEAPSRGSSSPAGSEASGSGSSAATASPLHPSPLHLPSAAGGLAGEAGTAACPSVRFVLPSSSPGAAPLSAVSPLATEGSPASGGAPLSGVQARSTIATGSSNTSGVAAQQPLRRHRSPSFVAAAASWMQRPMARWVIPSPWALAVAPHCFARLARAGLLGAPVHLMLPLVLLVVVGPTWVGALMHLSAIVLEPLRAETSHAAVSAAHYLLLAAPLAALPVTLFCGLSSTHDAATISSVGAESLSSVFPASSASQSAGVVTGRLWRSGFAAALIRSWGAARGRDVATSLEAGAAGDANRSPSSFAFPEAPAGATPNDATADCSTGSTKAVVVEGSVDTNVAPFARSELQGCQYCLLEAVPAPIGGSPVGCDCDFSIACCDCWSRLQYAGSAARSSTSTPAPGGQTVLVLPHRAAALAVERACLVPAGRVLMQVLPEQEDASAVPAAALGAPVVVAPCSSALFPALLFQGVTSDAPVSPLLLCLAALVHRYTKPSSQGAEVITETRPAGAVAPLPASDPRTFFRCLTQRQVAVLTRLAVQAAPTAFLPVSALSASADFASTRCSAGAVSVPRRSSPSAPSGSAAALGSNGIATAVACDFCSQARGGSPRAAAILQLYGHLLAVAAHFPPPASPALLSLNNACALPQSSLATGRALQEAAAAALLSQACRISPRRIGRLLDTDAGAGATGGVTSTNATQTAAAGVASAIRALLVRFQCGLHSATVWCRRDALRVLKGGAASQHSATATTAVHASRCAACAALVSLAAWLLALSSLTNVYRLQSLVPALALLLLAVGALLTPAPALPLQARAGG